MKFSEIKQPGFYWASWANGSGWFIVEFSKSENLYFPGVESALDHRALVEFLGPLPTPDQMSDVQRLALAVQCGDLTAIRPLVDRCMEELCPLSDAEIKRQADAKRMELRRTKVRLGDRDFLDKAARMQFDPMVAEIVGEPMVITKQILEEADARG